MSGTDSSGATPIQANAQHKVLQMTDLIILLLPVFMFSDYYLTIWGAKLREKCYADHFQIPSYELNPIWQADIREKKIINYRFMTIVVTIFLLVVFLFKVLKPSPFLTNFLSGYILAHYGILIGRHLSNIFLFNYTIKNATEIAGQIQYSQEYSLHASMYQYSVAILPLLFIGVWIQTPFILGCALAGVGYIVMHRNWIRKLRKGKTRETT